MANILSGIECKNHILEENKEKIKYIRQKLKLVVIRVGEEEASKIYVNNKRKACLENNIDFEEIHFEEKVKENEIIETIKKLNADKTVTSILVQLPLPIHLDSNKIINEIDYKKDVDGLTNNNQAKLLNKEDSIIPCTAKGILDLLNYYSIPVKNKNITIIGRSKLVGKPLACLLTNNDATVTLCHSKTPNLKLHTKNADIVIVAIGKAKYIKKDYLTDNQTIIDVGINRIDGKICGDVDFEDCQDLNINITPVPKGIGPMTIASVITNIICCYKLQQDKE